MYIDNLISKLKSMTKTEMNQFESIAYDYHVKKLYNVRLRKADFKIQLENFINKKTTKISFNNLDSYLYALDQLTEDGATEALNSRSKGNSITWRELFTKITTDVALPNEVDTSYLDNTNLKTLKSILQRVLKLCAGNDKDEIGRRLRTINDFLDIASNKNRN